MIFLLLFIWSVFPTAISALPQVENDVQALSTNQVDSSNLEPIAIDDTNVNTANSFYDPYTSGIDSSNPTDDPVSQNSLISIDEAADEPPTDFSSTNIAGSKIAACDPRLATRDELDNSILGYSSSSIFTTNCN